jgi:ribonuclease-3
MTYPQAVTNHISELVVYLEQWWVIFPTPLDEVIFVQAFIHKSFAADLLPALPDNERREFLGDAVVGHTICKKLFQDFPNLSEAELTLAKIFLVKEATLATVAREIGLYTHIFLGRGEEKSGGRDKDAILSDCYEAVVWMISLLAWEQQAETFVLRTLYPHLPAWALFPAKSAKSLLQEYCQQTYQTLPTYTDEIAEQESTGNVLMYRTTVSLNGQTIASSVAPSKKKAQELAAEEAVRALGIKK